MNQHDEFTLYNFIYQSFKFLLEKFELSGEISGGGDDGYCSIRLENIDEYNNLSIANLNKKIEDELDNYVDNNFDFNGNYYIYLNIRFESESDEIIMSGTESNNEFHVIKEFEIPLETFKDFVFDSINITWDNGDDLNIYYDNSFVTMQDNQVLNDILKSIIEGFWKEIDVKNDNIDRCKITGEMSLQELINSKQMILYYEESYEESVAYSIDVDNFISSYI